MRKLYYSLINRKCYLCVLTLLVSISAVTAQTPTYFKGLGTAANTIPMNTAGSHTQQIYLPGDFNTLPISGLITKIYFRNTVAASSGTYTNFSVAFLQNSMTAFPDNTFLTGFTTALSAASITINGNPVVGGWYEIPLTTPIAYDNSQTLIVEIKYTSRTGGMSGYTTSATVNKRLSITTAPGPLTGNLSTLWGDYGMDVIPSGPCTNPPVPGTIVSSANPVCISVPFTLTMNGGTQGAGQTYQWQSSPDGLVWTDIPGAVNSSLNTSQTVSTYYRINVTCGVTVPSASIQVLTPAAVQGVFTINNNLPTGGTNFASFNAAYDYIKCGITGPVTFNVDPLSGPYNEQLVMIPVPGASSTNTVTFNGNGRNINFNSTTTGQRAVIKLDGADHITFNDLVVTAPGTLTTEYGFGFHLINDADSNVINNCTINLNTSSSSTNYAGIVVSASHTSATGTGTTLCDDNVFSNNTITGGVYGITLVGSNAAANQSNRIIKNNISEFYQYGIYVTFSFNTLVDSNTISRPTRSVVTAFNGIYFTGLSVSANVTRNTIRNPFGGDNASTSAMNGIFFTAVDPIGGLTNIVSNNLLYNFTGNGIISAIHNSSSENLLVYHNTIALDGTGSGDARGFYQTLTAAGIEFMNNIVTITRGGTGSKYAIYYNTAASDVASNFNDFYINPVATNAFTGFATTAQATLANWQGATGDDLNSITTSPDYEDIGSGNYRPTNASMDNLGTFKNILIDILGTSRSLTTPDMGAYEFTPAACISPATPGTAIVNQTPVCTNMLVGLSITGHTTGLGQTYQWQSSPDDIIYTDFGGVLTNPNINITSSVTLYYRVAITCSGITVHSAPVLLTVYPALPANTYTINSAVATGGLNFNSFADVKAALDCGIAGPVIFDVIAGSGPYNEQFILNDVAGTSATNTITFNGNGETIAFSSSTTGERAVIKLRGTDHVTFDSLVIDARGAGTYGFGVHLIADADSNRFTRNTILANNTSTTLANFAGIVISSSETSATTAGSAQCDGNVIDRNTIDGGGYAITCVGSTTVANQNNVITRNIITDFYQYGIYLLGNYNTLVEANDISRPTRALVADFNGIFVTSLNVSVDISKNRIHNPFGGALLDTDDFFGIYFTGVDALPGVENIVSNNLIYNGNGAGPHYGLYNIGSNNVHYYYNTISLDDLTSTATAVTHGFYQTTLADGIDFKNNLITISRSSTGEKTAIVFNTTTSTITSNYNNFFVIPSANSYIGSLGTVDYATLPAWQAATAPGDVNSWSTNPFYTSVATGNFEPMSTTLDNKGTPIPGITTDIENETRSAATPDIGAYEFTVAPCTAPPTAGVADASPSSGICLGTPVFLSLSANSSGSGQTYQWQFSPTLAGPYTNMGGIRQFPDTMIFASSTLYYQVLVTCSGNTVASTPVLVTINPAFLGGVYTINPANPPFYPTAGSTNFESFTTAVAALECGITDDVTFNVAAGTYNEQIRMHAIAGTGTDTRVTFQSANGDPSSVNLTFASPSAANNYTLKLDSASYITYRNMTITATNSSFGRAVELANTASYDSIHNCNLVAPASTTASNVTAGLYADLLRGSNNVIKGNTITNGGAGIYFEGTAIASLTYDNVIDSNIVNGSYQYGIFVGFNGRAMVSNNTVNVTMPRNATNYGIYSTSSDSAYQYLRNRVNIDGVTATTTYGMYFTGCDANANNRGRIASNIVNALTGNTGTLYGIYQTASVHNNTVNNVVSINTSGATSYGTYMTGGGGVRFQNNSVQNASPSTSLNNWVAYFSQTSGLNPSMNVQNNIFYHSSVGKAMNMANLNFVYSNYNTYYTNGPVLINTYPTLQAWIDASGWDINSIVYEPAFTNNTTLTPDLTDPDVWAIHGRGTQIAGNDYDFNNNPRPVTFTGGVPDMGAYEFLPTALPTVLTATPAVPAAGQTQTFMYGTDTVAKVTYHPTAPVPASISMRRYSGVLPTGLTAGQQAMYFYTQLEVPAQGAYSYTMQQFYIDPWRGFVPSEAHIKMGRTNPASAWVVSPTSTTDTYGNVIRDTGIVFIDRYTGMAGDSTTTPTTPYTTVIDTSNRGTRFWVPYGHHYSFSSNGQDMQLYLSAEAAANVTVRVNGTSWARSYAIPANTVRVSDFMPKSGLIDSRITDEGLFETGISITSDVPIVAYAHIHDGATSGATMLLPVGVYGYEYQSLNSRQYYPTGGAGSYSWFAVISDRDSTIVEITPSVTTKAGRPAGVPFTVMLMRGQVYNVMGTISGATGTDISGSTIRSVANANGVCYPIAVFSGSSRTAICNTTNGDNLIQQVFPSQAWGKRYLTFATAQSTSTTGYNSNIYRIMVKDATTVVNFNGTTLPLASLVVPGNYYEVSTTTGTGPNGSVYVDADKPVMVAQYMISTGANSCPGLTATGNGDPEMIYISPIEQGIKKAVFYNTNQSAITSNYINVVIPTAGLASLTIDGGIAFTDVFPHPHLAGYTAIRHNLGAVASQHIIQSDSAFTAITYGLGSVESYGYNAGTLVKNLNAQPNIVNTLGSGSTSEYTCVNAPFRFNILITAKPQVLEWNFSAVSTLNPNTDVLQNNPVPVDSVIINGRWFYKYTVATDYIFTAPGTFYIPILITDSTTIEGCDNTQEVILTVNVLAAPVVDFTVDGACLGTAVQFNGIGTPAPGASISTWTWTFGDSNGASVQNPTHSYAAPGTYDISLSLIASDGCVADTTKTIEIGTIGTVAVIEDTLRVCGTDPVVFEVANPNPASTYNWYTTPTGGAPVFTGPVYTIPTITGPVTFYVEETNASGCISERTLVTADIFGPLITPIAIADSVGTDLIRFRWDPVPGAITYMVSINGGVFETPSSGPTGLTHLVTGLMPLDEVTIIVRAIGAASCQLEDSEPLTVRTHPTDIYIPNAFSPNGDGLNDVLLVYGYTIQTMRMMIFNQWGEKIFESNTQSTGWNGSHKGKMQPSGVYMYVCQITLKDGTELVKKGSINLVR